MMNSNNNSANYQFSGFSYLPPVVKNLLIINALFFLADLTLGTRGIDLTKYLGLHYYSADNFYPFQYITYMFMHGSFSHLFFNMFALWMFGYALENYWGGKRFLFYYLVTGIGAGMIQTLAMTWDIYNLSGSFGAAYINSFINNAVTIGASGAVFGILLAFGMIFPNTRIYIYFLFPLKAKWFVLLYGLIELFAGISGSGGNIAHFAHLGGMLFGVVLILYWKKHGSRF
ncbi:MAG: rhomboid family intramembrane serine protease [Bacteroidales bacterium]